MSSSTPSSCSRSACRPARCPRTASSVPPYLRASRSSDASRLSTSSRRCGAGRTRSVRPCTARSASSASTCACSSSAAVSPTPIPRASSSRRRPRGAGQRHGAPVAAEGGARRGHELADALGVLQERALLPEGLLLARSGRASSISRAWKAITSRRSRREPGPGVATRGAAGSPATPRTPPRPALVRPRGRRPRRPARCAWPGRPGRAARAGRGSPADGARCAAARRPSPSRH